jgi:hypothetical protein
MNEESKTEVITEEPKKAEEKKQAPAPAQLKASNEVAMILGTTLEERFRAASLYAASGMLPKGYDKPEKVFAGIQYAIEIGFKQQPLTALRNIAIINGQPSLWGELPLAMVERSGLLQKKYRDENGNELDGIEEYWVDKDGNRLSEDCKPEQVWAAIIEVERLGRKRKKFAYTQADRNSLGVAAIWKSFEKVMMKRKARAIGLKDVFPDVLLGIGIAEYDHHVYLDEEKDTSEMTVLNAQGQKLQTFKDKFKKADQDSHETESKVEGV